ILDSRTQHLNHFFNEAWQVRSDSYTYGHDIEATWLICEAAEVLGDSALVEHVGGIALRMAEVTLKEGIETDGGLCYEAKAGKIVDRGKEWWPQAEAVIGFINAFQMSKDAKYLDAARRVWDFIEQRLVDRAHGEWFWRITPEGQVDDSLPKVSEWKDPYHAARACLEATKRLQKFQSDWLKAEHLK
ncbi:MAG TPA: AGE family epimerase/isomerase, partial [Candidatus Saccharimonadales bacterium]|nr:AGE family epimerase/isomerase [Candidatus Saccharimonadales bacterium]